MKWYRCIYSLYCKEKINSLDIGRNGEMLDMRQKKAIIEELKTRYMDMMYF